MENSFDQKIIDFLISEKVITQDQAKDVIKESKKREKTLLMLF